MSGLRDSFNTIRAFGWGIVIVGDSDTQEIPAPDRDKPIVSSDSAVVILVRHAQDVVEPDDEEWITLLQGMVWAGLGTDEDPVLVLARPRRLAGP